MGRAVNIGILVSVKVAEPVDDALRLLGGRGIIQPDQRTAVHAFPQDRKIPPDGFHVEGLRREVQAREFGPGVRGPGYGDWPGNRRRIRKQRPGLLQKGESRECGFGGAEAAGKCRRGRASRLRRQFRCGGLERDRGRRRDTLLRQGLAPAEQRPGFPQKGKGRRRRLINRRGRGRRGHSRFHGIGSRHQIQRRNAALQWRACGEALSYFPRSRKSAEKLGGHARQDRRIRQTWRQAAPSSFICTHGSCSRPRLPVWRWRRRSARQSSSTAQSGTRPERPCRYP